MPDITSLIETLTSTVTIFGKKIPIGILIVGGVVILWLVTSKLKPKTSTPAAVGETGLTSSSAGLGGFSSGSANDVANIQASVAQQIEKANTDNATNLANMRDQLTGAFNTRVDTLQANFDTQSAALRSSITANSTALDTLKGTVSGITSLLDTARTNLANLTSRVTGVESNLAATRTGLSNLESTVTGTGGILTRLGVSEATIAGQKSDITTIKGSLTAASKRADDAYAYAASANSSLMSFIGGQQTLQNTFRTDLGALQARASSLESSFSKITDSKDPNSLASLATKASSSAALAVTQVTALNTSFAGFKKIYDTLQATVSSVLTRLGLIEADTAAAKQALDTNVAGSVGNNAAKVPSLVAALNSNTIGSVAYNANVAYNAYSNQSNQIRDILATFAAHGWQLVQP